MKLTEEQLKSVMNDNGEIDNDKLSELNKLIESEVSKSFNSGIEKAKKETPMVLNDKVETSTTDNPEVEELRKKLDEMSKMVSQTSEQQKISNFKKKIGNTLSTEQVESLINTVPADKLDEFNVDVFARKSLDNDLVNELPDNKVKEEKQTDKDLIKQMRDLR